MSGPKTSKKREGILGWMNDVAVIGGITKNIPIQLATSAGAYAIDDVVGGAVDVTELYNRNESGIINSIKAQFIAGVSAVNLDVYFFSKLPTAVDNDSIAFTEKEMKSMVPVKISLLSADKETIGTTDFVMKSGLFIPYQALQNSDNEYKIYMVTVARTGVTLGSTSGLHVTLGVMVD